ncbi:MAG: hypothetical protein AB7J35_07115 [Dehalococcoidia bacterium]
MKRILPLATLLALLPFALFASSCGGDDDDSPPIQLQQTDRDRITDIAETYVDALQTRDMTTAKDMLIEGVPEATINKAMDTVRDEGFRLVSIGDVSVDGTNVEVLVALTDKDYRSVTRKLEFRQDSGEWVVYSPHLKPLS